MMPLQEASLNKYSVMSDSSVGRSSFFTQANALFLKNLTFQKRNLKSNIALVVYPFVLCLLLLLAQIAVKGLSKVSREICEDGSCSILSPPEWPPLLQLPQSKFRAVRSTSYPDLPVCINPDSCQATILVTGQNQTLHQNLTRNLITRGVYVNSSDVLYSLSNILLGSDAYPGYDNFREPAFSGSSLYVVQPQCKDNSTISIYIPTPSKGLEKQQPEVQTVPCVKGLSLWRNSSSLVNDELFKGYLKGNPQRNISEFIAAYDFLNSNTNNFNVSIWYNSTFKDGGLARGSLLRILRSVNVASNAYLQILKGAGVKMLFEFVKEMPEIQTLPNMDFASALGPLFFSWVVLQLFPVIVASLVYERQQNLRIMMKMHGLGDGPYWMITYMYFLFLSLVYMLCFVISGSLIGMKFFTWNDYSIQFVFYFIYINLQISVAFLAATLFSNVKTATVIGHMYVFGSGLLGTFLFQNLVEDTSFPRGWLAVLEIYPPFSLFRGLYEFAECILGAGVIGNNIGMRWDDLNDGTNGMRELFILMLVEWFIVLVVAYYLDQAMSFGSGVKHPLFFLKNLWKKPTASFQRMGSNVFVEIEKPDVLQERERVDKLVLERNTSHAIICDNLKKVYPGQDGNPEKIAVRGLSLALPRGECFGMLGPNGAGKTSFISMMIGLQKPTSGAAFVEGLDIQTDMDKVYNSMGVCPQHDLLWEQLTGREHLLFYGRLKNLKGAALTQAVDESLKSVNLFQGGVGDKKAGTYSGGMKRRLSVAISLIGDPKVVYMDEPSTGLDPASRNGLWNIVKRAKQNRVIILTTHSMEEAEVLCDRLGIFVDGGLQCIGHPRELKARYGGSYVFTMTTSSNEEAEVERLVHSLSPNANKVYHLSGTQKFELPKKEVRIADVFQAVEIAKTRFPIYAWGLTDTTLEDVFIKVALAALASQSTY